MGKTAFIDITGREGSLYMLDKRSGRLLERIPFSVGGDGELRMERIPVDVGDCFVSLPPSMLGFRVLSLPFADLDKVRQVLPYELDGLVLGDTDDLAIDARMFQGKVLAAFVQNKTLRSLLSSLQAVGLEPDAVTSLDLGAALGKSRNEQDLINSLGGTVVEGEERVHCALAEIDKRTVDFRRGEFASQKRARMARKSLRLTAALVLILCLVFSADMAVRTVGANREALSIKASMTKIYSEVFPERAGDPPAGLNYKMRAELGALQARESSVRGVDALQFMMELQKLKSPKWRLSSLLLDSGLTVLKGDANSLSDVQELKEAVEGLTGEAAITDSGQSATGGVSFTITARGEGK